MISPQQFKQFWEHPEHQSHVQWRLNPFPSQTLTDVRLKSEFRAFLVQAGLPDEAAPFLNFEPPKTGTLQRVSVVWHQEPAFDRYRIIGSNGSGDPVCIDEDSDGQIVYLNHDNTFQRVLMASTVITLAECLVQFRSFISEVGGVRDPIAPERFAPLIERFRAIDTAVSEVDSYWQQEFKSFQ